MRAAAAALAALSLALCTTAFAAPPHPRLLKEIRQGTPAPASASDFDTLVVGAERPFLGHYFRTVSGDQFAVEPLASDPLPGDPRTIVVVSGAGAAYPAKLQVNDASRRNLFSRGATGGSQ